MIDTLWIPAIAKKLCNSVDLQIGGLARYIAIDNSGGGRNEAAIFFEDEAVDERGTRDERLDEINAEEADEVDEGGDESDDGGAFTQTDDKR
ncbi:hypothetical protein U1Q18_018722, partial [Sarracenia purpurea var. burkii]